MSPQVRAVKVELVTDTHRIMGYYPTNERRLSDILNLDSTDSIVLDDVCAVPVDNPDGAPIGMDFAHIIKDRISFGIPHEPPSTAEERQRTQPFQYVDKDRHQVLVSLPPFSVTGYLHLVKHADIRSALQALAAGFVPITRARAIYMPDTRIGWAAEVIIINRKRAQIFWPPMRVNDEAPVEDNAPLEGPNPE